jgi:hypothetical protein
MMVQRGFATVTRHREGEERSAIYDRLLEAEDFAKKKKNGLHRCVHPHSQLAASTGLCSSSERLHWHGVAGPLHHLGRRPQHLQGGQQSDAATMVRCLLCLADVLGWPAERAFCKYA